MIQNGSQVSYEEHGDALVIRIRGEIDHHSAVSVRAGVDDVLAARQPERVFLDLSGVDFMDSSGLGLVMGRYTLVKELGGAFAVVDPSPAIMRIFKLAGMERLIQIETTKQEGDGSIRHKAG